MKKGTWKKESKRIKDASSFVTTFLTFLALAQNYPWIVSTVFLTNANNEGWILSFHRPSESLIYRSSQASQHSRTLLPTYLQLGVINLTCPDTPSSLVSRATRVTTRVQRFAFRWKIDYRRVTCNEVTGVVLYLEQASLDRGKVNIFYRGNEVPRKRR